MLIFIIYIQHKQLNFQLTAGDYLAKQLIFNGLKMYTDYNYFNSFDYVDLNKNRSIEQEVNDPFQCTENHEDMGSPTSNDDAQNRLIKFKGYEIVDPLQLISWDSDRNFQEFDFEQLTDLPDLGSVFYEAVDQMNGNITNSDVAEKTSPASDNSGMNLTKLASHYDLVSNPTNADSLDPEISPSPGDKLVRDLIDLEMDLTGLNSYLDVHTDPDQKSFSSGDSNIQAASYQTNAGEEQTSISKGTLEVPTKKKKEGRTSLS